jgi:hypothetical protein
MLIELKLPFSKSLVEALDNRVTPRKAGSTELAVSCEILLGGKKKTKQEE